MCIIDHPSFHLILLYNNIKVEFLILNFNKNYMGIFDIPKPRVSKKEFKEVQSILSSKELTKNERNKVEQIFFGALHEKGTQEGIDLEEINQGIEWMRKNPSKHGISLKKIDAIEQALKKKT